MEKNRINQYVMAGIAVLMVIDAAIYFNFARKNRSWEGHGSYADAPFYKDGIFRGKDGFPYNGVMKYFYEDGTLRHELTYSAGEVVGPWRGYYPGGGLEYEYIASRENRYVSGKAYREDGTLESTVEQKNGVSTVTRYDRQGRVTSEKPMF